MKQHFIGTVFLYLDAGTGSQILQIAVATAIGAAFGFKTGWQRIKLFLKKIFSDADSGK